MRMRSDRWLVLVGALGVTLGSASATAAAGLTGTLVLDNNGPSMDAAGRLPSVQLSWSVQCPGTTSPIYYVTGPQLVRVADGKDLAVSVLNLQGDSMPTSGVLNEGEPVGTVIQAMWPAGTISCAPGPGTGNTGGGSNADINSNSIVVPPFIDPQLIWGGATPATAPVNLPLYLSLPTVPSAFGADPADSESVSIFISGPGISYSKSFSGADWHAGGVANDPDWKTLIPDGPGVISFSMQFQGVGSNVVAVTAVQLAGACQPCKTDADCASTLDWSLTCDQGMCNWPVSNGCKASGACGGYGCNSGDDSCNCPGLPSGTTKKGKGCDVAADAGGSSDGGAQRGAAALLCLAAIAWSWRRRRRRRS